MATPPSSSSSGTPAFPPPPPRPPLLDRATGGTGLLLIAVILVAWRGVMRPIADPDFWWHLKTGQLIVQHGGLLGTDPYTFTVSDHAWVMHEWLTEVMYAGLYAAGGLGLIVAVLSLVTWLGLLCVVWKARLGRPALGGDGSRWPVRPGYLVTAAGLTLGLLAGYPIWGPRAQMITFALCCLVLALAERHLLRGGRMIWWLVPVFLLWSNLHSGFVIGLGFIVLIVVAELIGSALRWQGGAPRRRVWDLCAVAVAGLLVAMINPNGPAIVLYPFATFASPAQQAVIQEWHSPDFHDGLVRAFEVMVVTLAALVVINRRIRARDAMLVLATTALALQSVRNIALFVAAATPVWITQAELVAQRVERRLFPQPAGAASPHSACA